MRPSGRIHEGRGILRMPVYIGPVFAKVLMISGG
jgi:hypothetical protein